MIAEPGELAPLAAALQPEQQDVEGLRQVGRNAPAGRNDSPASTDLRHGNPSRSSATFAKERSSPDCRARRTHHPPNCLATLWRAPRNSRFGETSIRERSRWKSSAV